MKIFYSQLQIFISTSHNEPYSAFTLPTLELDQTNLILFSKFDINRVTWEVPVVVLLSTCRNKTTPVWHSSEVAV